jgi:uncharacterized protein (DUF342 family)
MMTTMMMCRYAACASILYAAQIGAPIRIVTDALTGIDVRIVTDARNGTDRFEVQLEYLKHSMKNLKKNLMKNSKKNLKMRKTWTSETSSIVWISIYCSSF